jgi:hypothetical protein
MFRNMRFYTDVSCLGEVFAKNSSRETNNFTSRMAREIYSQDWYFSQIPLTNMIYLFNYTEYYLEHWLKNNTFCLSFSGPNTMYLFNSTEWCYIKRTTDNVLQILLQASRWRVKTANTILQIPWKKVKSYANTLTWSKNSANSQCKA